MLKYVNHDIVFQEFPDEVTLAINLSLCPNGCPGCHSAYLQGNVGEELTLETLEELVGKYKDDITCVGFMGGDNDPGMVGELARGLKMHYPKIHIGWYSGHSEIWNIPALHYFDYIKVGPYIEKCGPLNSRTTNQRMYKQENRRLIDITYRFWRN